MPQPSIPLILIVDDYPDALDIYRTYLAFKGYRVVTASGGSEAVEVARQHRPNVIFMDLRMPDLSGTEAMLILRKDPTFSNVPIVALTAHALDYEKWAALKAGFNEVIPKPCLPEELVAAVDRLLAE